jgi:hypothetical protein
VAAFAQGVFRRLAGLQGRARHSRISADRQGVVVVRPAGGQGHEASGAIGLGKRPRPPGRHAALVGGLDPDLEDPGGRRLEVVFRMADAGTCAHHLDVAGFGPALVAEAVLVADGALADVGDDLHVRVRVRREPGVRGDLVVVPDPQASPAGPRRIVIAGEGKVVPGLQPAVVGAAEGREGPFLDHLSGLLRGAADPQRPRSDVKVSRHFAL